MPKKKRKKKVSSKKRKAKKVAKVKSKKISKPKSKGRIIEKLKMHTDFFHIYTFGGLKETNKWLKENKYV